MHARTVSYIFGLVVAVVHLVIIVLLVTTTK